MEEIEVLKNKACKTVRSLLNNVDVKYKSTALSTKFDKKKIEYDANRKIWNYNLKININEISEYELNYLLKISYVKWYNENYAENKIEILLVVPDNAEINLRKIVDHDSTEIAWKFYASRYGARLDGNMFHYKDISFKVSGEVDFNFGRKKIKEFKYIIDNDTTAAGKGLAKTLLEICAQYNYSLLNFSVMPQTGNLQGTKSSIGNDRFDVFVWAIDLYYKHIDLVVNSHTTVQNASELILTLDKIGSGYNYCDIIYNIDDEKIIERLISSGGKRIDSTARVLEYIALAVDVWNIRRKKFVIDKNKDIFEEYGGNKDMKEFIPFIKELSAYGCKLKIEEN